MVERVLITAEAAILLQELKSRYGKLLFHQSGGCCDGSAPMCFEESDFKVGSSDIKLGEIEGCPFYMNEDQYSYWKHTQLIIDLTKGRGSSFSLEIPLGYRFISKSRLFTEQECEELEKSNS